MPGRDGTGPMGHGPMTGGGRGPCGGTAPPREPPQGGAGRGLGRGGGWRRRHGFRANDLTGRQRGQKRRSGAGSTSADSASKERELAALRQQAESLEQALSDLKSKIRDLDGPARGAPEKEHT